MKSRSLAVHMLFMQSLYICVKSTMRLQYARVPTTALTNEKLISRRICTEILITFLYEKRTLSSSLICRSPRSFCILTI